MDEKKMGRRRRRGAAVCAAVVFALSALPMSARAVTPAAEMPRELIPVGQAIGVKLFSEGVLVVALSEEGKAPSPAKEGGVKVGDLIVTMNDVAIESTEHLQALIEENGEAAAALSVRRGARTVTLDVHPKKGEDGVCRLGAWIRDSMAGIGTVTYYDPASGRFAALGHGITDVDTGKLMPLAHGAVMAAGVKAVRRGESGAPGELHGDFDLTRDLGTLYANTDCGIFGVWNEGDCPDDLGAALPLASREEVQEGKAQILSTCSGSEACAYEIEIEKIYGGSSPTRNLLLRVTDPALLARTGGIVQGMSGSPIIQNGKFVGAVTHVLVDDPTKGYGILIENMLNAAG